MLSLYGFIDLTSIELFTNETPLGWQRFGMLLRHYGVWRELGDAPRSMFPVTPLLELKERVRAMSLHAGKKAARKIEVNRVELELKVLGEQNAVDLLDPPGTRYYYYKYN